jgi:hypothetical protein
MAKVAFFSSMDTIACGHSPAIGDDLIGGLLNSCFMKCAFISSRFGTMAPDMVVV